MPSNYTTNCRLNQWEPGDKVLRTDFNADNARIDAALKAESDARTAGDAAEARAREALSAQVARLGNCRVCFTTYTGTGSAGDRRPASVTFPGRPLFIVAGKNGGSETLFAIQGNHMGVVFSGSEIAAALTTWSGNTVTWSTTYERFELNYSGVQYNIMALIAADE